MFLIEEQVFTRREDISCIWYMLPSFYSTWVKHGYGAYTLGEGRCIYLMCEINIATKFLLAINAKSHWTLVSWKISSKIACYLMSWTENISATRTILYLKPTGHVCQPIYAYTHAICILNLKWLVFQLSRFQSSLSGWFWCWDLRGPWCSEGWNTKRSFNVH